LGTTLRTEDDEENVVEDEGGDEADEADDEG